MQTADFKIKLGETMYVSVLFDHFQHILTHSVIILINVIIKVTIIVIRHLLTLTTVDMKHEIWSLMQDLDYNTALT